MPGGCFCRCLSFSFSSSWYGHGIDEEEELSNRDCRAGDEKCIVSCTEEGVDDEDEGKPPQTECRSSKAGAAPLMSTSSLLCKSCAYCTKCG